METIDFMNKVLSSASGHQALALRLRSPDRTPDA